MYGNSGSQNANQHPPRTQSAQGGSLSKNELDFKTYVLYVIPGDDSSQQALEIAAKFNDIQISNVLTVPPAKRPRWLNGAPILVNIRENKAHRGSEALRELKKITAELLGESGSPGIGYDSTIEYDSTTSTNTTRSTNAGCSIVPMLDDERKYTNRGKLKDNEINLYANSRAQNPAPI